MMKWLPTVLSMLSLAIVAAAPELIQAYPRSAGVVLALQAALNALVKSPLMENK